MPKQDAEQLTFYPAGFPASRFPSPGSEEVQQMTVTSGRKCCELLTNSDPLSLLAKMLLASSRWQSRLVTLQWKAETLPLTRTVTRERSIPKRNGTSSPEYCKTLNVSVIKSSYLYFRLVPQTPRTDATECALLPTPTTPRPHDSENTVGKYYPSRNQFDLAAAVQMIGTPTANMSSCGRSEAFKKGRTPNPVEFVQMFPTPTVGAPLCGGSGNYEQLKRLVDSDTITEYEKRQMAQQGGGQLNPDWVEWLMGFPAGWTDISKDVPLPEYDPHWYDAEPNIPRTATGIPNRVDRLKALGNAVDPYQFYPVCECIATILREIK